MRIGNGYDTHRLVSGRKLILGGVHVAHDCGLEGHSDGDALSHAIIDALLGAACLGDIGMWFPPGDPKWKDADSQDMLRQVKSALSEHGFEIINIDSVVICERPKLSPHFEAMRSRLAESLDIPVNKISVKATTNEGMGDIGQGQAIAVHTVALIEASK